MTLKDDIASDAGTFYDTDEFAVDGTYNGTSVRLVEDGGFFGTTEVPGVYEGSRTVHVLESEVPNPKPGDKVICNGSTYKVGGNPQYDGGVWQLTIYSATATVTV